jgi:hypothetical protein
VLSLEIVQIIICKLTNIPGEKDNIIRTSVSIISKKKNNNNKNYQMLFGSFMFYVVLNILCGNNEDLPKYFTPSIVTDMKCAPLTSVE